MKGEAIEQRAAPELLPPVHLAPVGVTPPQWRDGAGAAIVELEESLEIHTSSARSHKHPMGQQHFHSFFGGGC